MLLSPRASDPVTLASELEGIVPIERLESGDEASVSGGSPRGMSPRFSVRHSGSFREQKEQAVAPYQALPVQGPVVHITEHLTPALDVVEPQRGVDNAEVRKSVACILSRGIYLDEGPEPKFQAYIAWCCSQHQPLREYHKEHILPTY